MDLNQETSVQRIDNWLSEKVGRIAKARAEYSRLRSIAAKRIERAHKQGELLDYIKPISLSDIKPEDTRTLAKALRDVNKFLASKRSTSAGRTAINRKKVKTLQERGFKNVSMKNIKAFNMFMERFRETYVSNTPDGRRMYRDSDEAAEFVLDRLERDTKITESTVNAIWDAYVNSEYNK